MGYFEFLLYILTAISSIDIMRWAYISIKYDSYLKLLNAFGGDWNTSTKIRHYVEILILVICATWTVWKYIIN